MNSESPLTFLYLIQTSSSLPIIFECLRCKNFALLSYKENTSDTNIFYPNSTWTTGRNKLREYALSLEQKYDYYIFLDEDVVFTNYDQTMGFNVFEYLINKYKPPVANPNFVGYYDTTTFPYSQPLQEAQTTIWYDGLCNAFSYNTLTNTNIFPYIDKLDNKSWWMSQYAIIILSSIFNIDICVFPHLLVKNIQSSNYPRNWSPHELENLVYSILPDENRLLSLSVSPLSGESIFKITDYLNKYFVFYDKVNIIDVGCSIGDFKRYLNIQNMNIIGVDPIISKYKSCLHNILDTYNMLYENAIDAIEDDHVFNVTESLDTSSLYEFDFNNITTDASKENSFFIPENIIGIITNIQEQITVKTITLNNVIEKSNLSNSIIHIVKITTQGNDLNVIKSCEKYLKNVLFVVLGSTYDNSSFLYKNGTKLSEDCEYMRSQGFEILLVEKLLKDDCHCLYYNKSLVKKFDLNWDKKTFKILSPID